MEKNKISKLLFIYEKVMQPLYITQFVVMRNVKNIFDGA